MFNSMKKLIEKKFYKTASEAQGKLDVFFAVSRLNMEEYTTLTLLVEEKYADATPDAGTEQADEP